MRRRAYIGLLLTWCPWVLPALPAADERVFSSLQLKDGRLVHNASIMSDEGASLVLKSDEGLLKVAKTDLPRGVLGGLPAGLQDSAAPGPELVMQPFNPDLAPAGPKPDPDVPKATPKQVTPVPTKAKQGVDPLFKGCAIKSFQMKPFQGVAGCIEVVVRNDTDLPVVLGPGDFLCETGSGAHHLGRNIITDGYPPHLKRREVVPPRGEIDDIVTFTNDALDNPSVRWAR